MKYYTYVHAFVYRRNLYTKYRRFGSDRIESGFVVSRRERICLEKQKERRKRLQIIEAGRNCTHTHTHARARVNRKDTFPSLLSFPFVGNRE